MRFLLTIMCLAVLGLGNLSAQYLDASAQEKIATRYTKALIEKVGLTIEQGEKVHCYYMEFLQQKSALFEERQQSGGDSLPFRMRLLDVKKESERKILSLMTADQARKFQVYQEEQKAQLQQGK